jgi:hypothetical protein
MPRDTEKTEEDCAKPVWANLFFMTDNNRRVLWNGSVGFHGLPRKGDLIEHTSADVEESLFGAVDGVRYGTTTDGSFKATVWVHTDRPVE